MPKEIKYRVAIEPDGGGGWHGYVPALRGCHTCGLTIEETFNNLKEAMSLHIEDMLACGDKLPVDEFNSEHIGVFGFQTVLIPESV